MKNNLKKIIKNNKVLHKIAIFVKKYFYIRFKKRYYIHMIKYLFCNKNREIKLLKRKGVTKIKTYKTDSWRFGEGLDKAFRRYYKGIIGGSSVFIKVAYSDSTIKNEIDFANYFKKYSFDFVPKTYFTDMNFDSNKQAICFEFFPNLKKISNDLSIKDFDVICQKFIEILSLLKENSIVHADIHENNLFINNGNLVLLDYGITSFNNVKNNVDYVARPGTFYNTTFNEDNKKIRIYDDAFSFVKMCEKLLKDDKYFKLDSFLEIKKRINQNILKVYL